MEEIKIKTVTGGKAPEYKTAGAAGADCYTRIIEGRAVIYPRETVKLMQGFCLALPCGYKGIISPRSSTSLRGLLVHEGTIDSDYRGEISAIVTNLGDRPRIINNGDRICQITIQEARQYAFVPVDELDKTVRGTNGFGSTGA